MKTTSHTFERSFGPVASFSGYLILAAGIGLLYYSCMGLILIGIGAFVGFTNSSSTIDFDNKRVRFTNNIFGFIRVGDWLSVSNDMFIGIKKENVTWRTYSRGNIALDISKKITTICLFNNRKKPLLPLKNIGLKDDVEQEMEELARGLDVTIWRHQ